MEKKKKKRIIDAVFFVLFVIIVLSPFYLSVHCDDARTSHKFFAYGTLNLVACSLIYFKVADYLDE